MICTCPNFCFQHTPLDAGRINNGGVPVSGLIKGLNTPTDAEIIKKQSEKIADLERERDEWKDQAMKIGGVHASVLLENNNLKGSAFKIGTIANLESENATLRAKLAALEGICHGLREGRELLRAEVERLKSEKSQLMASLAQFCGDA